MDSKIGRQREITSPRPPEFVFCRSERHITQMPLIPSRFLRFLPVAGVVLGLTGCGGMSEIGFDTKMALGSVSLVDRCSDFMHRAYPQESIDVTGSHVDTDAQSAVVTVQGVRSGVAAGSGYARDVAVECRFAGGILTGFRWVAGPVRPASPGLVP
jgi:hypothetical protein